MSNLFDIMDDIFGPLNVIDRAEGLVRQAVYRDTAVRFSLLRPGKGGHHTRDNVRRILAKYGIVIFGHTHDGAHFYFLVKSRQAAWAEYLLLHAGVKLQNKPVDPNNYKRLKKHPPGWMPTPWSEQQSDDHPSERTDQHPSEEKEKSHGAGSQLDRIIDRLNSV